MSEGTNLGPGWRPQKIVVPPPQNVGDVCESCKEFCDKMQVPRKKLVALGTTTEKETVVPICPQCDGDLILTNTPGRGPEELV